MQQASFQYVWNSWRNFHRCTNLVKAKAKGSDLQQMRYSKSHLPYTDILTKARMDNGKEKQVKEVYKA